MTDDKPEKGAVGGVPRKVTYGEQIGHCKSRKKVFKSFITKTFTKLDGLKDDPVTNKPKIQIQIKAIENKLKEYVDISKELEELYLECNENDNFEHCFEDRSDYEIEISTKLCDYSVLIPIPVVDKPVAKAKKEEFTPLVKPMLQPAKLPTFNGDYRNWSTFWQSFQSTIHDHPMQPVMKFNYLVSLLQGDALECIRGLPITNENYGQCIDILQKRFNVPHKLIESYMRDLSEIFSPSYAKASLQKFLDKINTSVRLLDTQGKNPKSYEVLLVPILIKKLPKEVKLTIAKDFNFEVTLQNILDTLNKEIRILEILALDSSCSNNEFVGKNNSVDETSVMFSHGKKCNSNSGNFKPNSNKGNRNRPQVKCSFCNFNHKSAECLKFKDPLDRYNRAKELNLCLICLKDNHKASECFYKDSACRICNRNNHSSLLCFSNSKKHTAGQTKVSLAHQSTELKPVDNSHVADKNCSSSSSCNTGESQNLNVDVSNNNTTVKLSISDDTISSPIEFCTVAGAESSASLMMSCSNNVLLKTATAKVRSDSASCYVNLIVDDGSMRTWVSEQIAELLNLQTVGYETLRITVFGTDDVKVRNLRVVKLTIVGLKGEAVDVYPLVIPVVSTPIHNNEKFDMKDYEEFRSLTLANRDIANPSFSIDLLIGSNYYYDIILNGFIKSCKGDLVATPSILGYIINGPIREAKKHLTCNETSVMKVLTETQSLNDTLKDMSKLELVGIEPPSKVKEPEFDIETYCSSLEFRDGFYTARLPWKPDGPFLPNNFNYSMSRTESLINNLVRNNLFDQYNDVIKMQLGKGFIEKEDPNDLKNCHYISHFPVIKPSLTTPLRVVFDASAKSTKDGGSLNSCLYSGPSLHNDMVGILLRSRISKFLLVSDIEKAFNMIKLNKIDQPYCRFLWLENIEDPHSDLVTYVFKVILFGTTSSMFILTITLIFHLKKYSNQVSYDIQNNCYVDNVIVGTNSKDYCSEFYETSRKMLAEGNFNLRSWASNNPEVLELATKDNVLYKDLENVGLFGLNWNVHTDMLSFKALDINSNATVTKRHILSSYSKFYDSLGLMHFIIVRCKILTQDLFIADIGWDTPITGEFLDRWNELSSDLIKVSNYKIPRFCFNVDELLPKVFKVHIFTDWSKRSMAFNAYIASNETCSLIKSSSRICPIEKSKVVDNKLVVDDEELTCPQGELIACLLGARFAKYLEKQLFDNKLEICFWTDSEVVLRWFSKIKLKPYQRKLMAELKQLVSIDQYYYCPSQLNPADINCRGVNFDDFKTKEELWFHGPEFLLHDKSNWPKPNFEIPSSLNEEPLVQVMPCISSFFDISKAIDIDRFSKLERLLRVTSYVFRAFCGFLKLKHHKGPITAEELNNSKLLWIKSVQKQIYCNEINLLKDKKANNLIKQLDLYLDYDILKSGGRIQNSSLPKHAREPILLPCKHPLTKLIIEDIHESVKHAGVGITVVEIRQHFWIPRIRQVVKCILRFCQCKRRTGRHYLYPKTPPLPYFRVEDCEPFTSVGIDFSGSIEILSTNLINVEKAYVTIFSCLTSRAIHLELVTDMSLPTFTCAFRRFCSYRGTPKICLSDNASTYLAASTALENLLRSDELLSYMAKHNCKWKFIPKRSPSFGGVYERMVGITKSLLKKVLGRSKLNFIELNSLLAELSCIINNRPITYQYGDNSELESLTPNHLLHGRVINMCPHILTSEDDILDPTFELNDRSSVVRRAKHRSFLVNQFFKLWKRDYLTSLRERHTCFGSKSVSVSVGDVVLIEDDKKPRLYWRLGLVTELHPGRDGLVRYVSLRTSTGSTNRAIFKLYPLEINHKLEPNQSNVKPVEPETRISLPRNAKNKASEKIRAQLNSDSE